MMTADHRLTELAQILAAGLLRSKRRESEELSGHLEKTRLDFPPERRVHG
jgi:hypothetical protein